MVLKAGLFMKKTAQNDSKNCPYCAETIQERALICRFCQRAVFDMKHCFFCAEPLRQVAKKCRFCLSEQPSVPVDRHPAVTTINPAHIWGSPVYVADPPFRDPERCELPNSMDSLRQSRLDAIARGDDTP